MTQPQIVATVAALRAATASWRAEDRRIVLVPTMGALHDGHLSLVRAGRARDAKVIVSIFVNPAQFAPNEDFAAYPRDLSGDVEKLAGADADLIFAPDAAEMYPDGFATAMRMDGPAEGLESDFRPHFFGGVALVVAKLLIAAAPDVAIFGEKDYQQLLVVRRMARDLALPVEIVGMPTMREADGLAMSSRNANLNVKERKIAGRMNAILTDAVAQLRTGAAIAAVQAQAVMALKDAGFGSVDYVAVRDAEDLRKIETIVRPARILAAAHIGRTRLIDNLPV